MNQQTESNKAMQSDFATCHALCVPHKDVPGCYAVDGGVSYLSIHMITTINLYHGTFCDFSKFRPFSHFGTKDVALDLIARKMVDDGYRQGTLVAISLHISEDQLLKLEDWGASHSLGLASTLKQASVGEEKENLQKIMNDISSEHEDRKSEWNENGFRILTQLLKDKNVTILKYPNNVEGSERSDSFCVLNPDAVEILSRESVEIGELKDRVEKWQRFNERYKRS